jgi:hypothetical protein
MNDQSSSNEEPSGTQTAHPKPSKLSNRHLKDQNTHSQIIFAIGHPSSVSSAGFPNHPYRLLVASPQTPVHM